MTEVRFFVDGVLLGTDTTAPYSIDWDTSGEMEGDHMLTAEAEDAAGNIGLTVGITVTVANILQFAVALDGEQQVPLNNSLATAAASLTINLVTGAVSGDLTITGLTATDAHIHDNYAGANGGVLIALEPDAGGDPDLFAVPAAAVLDAAGVDRLLTGALYINVHTAANPGGEIRGQILPDGFVLRFSDLAGFESVPQVDSLATGRAAVTLHQPSGWLAVHAQVEGLDDAIDWDTSGEMEGDHMLTAEAEDAAGNIGLTVGITVTVANILQFAVALDGEQQVPLNNSLATAAASLTINLVTGAVVSA